MTDIEHLGRLPHHPSGDVKRGDPRAQVRITRPKSGMAFVHVPEHDALKFHQTRRLRRRAEVRDRRGAWYDTHALMDRRQEAAVPDLSARVRQVFAEHHVRGKVGVECAQTMADPATNPWHGDSRRTRVHRENRLEMLDDVGVQRVDHTELVGHHSQVREQVADHQARLSIRPKSKRRAQQRAIVRFIGTEAEGGNGFSMIGVQDWLVIERVDVRKPTRQEDYDQVLGLRLMVGWPGNQKAAALPVYFTSQCVIAAMVRRGLPRTPMLSKKPGGPSLDVLSGLCSSFAQSI